MHARQRSTFGAGHVPLLEVQGTAHPAGTGMRQGVQPQTMRSLYMSWAHIPLGYTSEACLFRKLPTLEGLVRASSLIESNGIDL